MKKPAKRAHVKPHKRPAKKASSARKKPAKKPAARKRVAAPKRKVGKAKASATLASGHAYTPDAHDDRDHIYQPTTTRDPGHVDLSQAMPHVWDQADDEDCAAYAALAASVYTSSGSEDLTLPPDGPTGDIREVVKACAHGAEYLSVRPSDLPACLSDGMPVVFGVTLFESFAQSAAIIPMPAPEERVLGPHCMVAVGYSAGLVKVRNSWGTDAHDDGYLLMPLAYLERYAADCWAYAR